RRRTPRAAGRCPPRPRSRRARRSSTPPRARRRRRGPGRRAGGTQSERLRNGDAGPRAANVRTIATFAAHPWSLYAITYGRMVTEESQIAIGPRVKALREAMDL